MVIRGGEALPARGYRLLTACWYVRVGAERRCGQASVPGGTEETLERGVNL